MFYLFLKFGNNVQEEEILFLREKKIEIFIWIIAVLYFSKIITLIKNHNTTVVVRFLKDSIFLPHSS